jgi:endoglucanase
MQYTIKVDSSAAYNITHRYANLDNTGKIKFKLDGAAITETITLASTGGYQTWGNQTISNVVLYKGTHTFRFYFEKGGANIGYMKFALSKKISEVSFQATAAETAGNGKVLYITANKKTDATTVTSITGFSVKVDGVDSPVTSVQPDASNANRIIVTLNQDIFDNNVITISYNADVVKATDGTLLQDFSNLAVKNNLPFHFVIPAKIEAEAFVTNQGLAVENTSDTDGGQNVGHTHVGDYLEYRIRVPVDGTYPFEARIACNSQAGRLEFQQLSATGSLLNSVVIDIPVTNGWQNWKTVTGKLKLNQGSGKLRVRVVQPEFNMNWFRFLSADIISGTEKKRQGSLKVYPNPAEKNLHVELPDLAYSPDNTLSVRTLQGILVKNSKPLTHDKVQHVSVDDLPAGLYIIELALKDELYSNKFIVK